MGKALDEYLEILEVTIDDEDRGISRAIHKELRALAYAIQEDLNKLSIEKGDV